MKIATIILLMLAGIVVTPAKLELQRAEVVFPEQNWDRGDLLVPEFDEREVSAFSKTPDIKLKWAIISGGFGESVDRVRARVRFNDKHWIDLYARKIAVDRYNQSVVRLREFDGGQVAEIGDEVPDLRIQDWNHDKLLVKLTINDKEAVSYTHLTLPTTPYV